MTNKSQNLDFPPIPDEIIILILKELPAKSLIRFKIVSRNWHAMIQDPHFVDLHRNRSHYRPGGNNLLLRSNFRYKISQFDSKELSIPVPFKVPIPPIASEFHTENHLEHHSVEGLICLHNVIWNPITGETIRIPSNGIFIPFNTSVPSYLQTSNYFLGFDQWAEKHKVLDICKVSVGSDWIENYGYRKWNNFVFTSVWTLGTNFWRQGNDSFPTELFGGDFQFTKYCSIKGVMYWLICVRYEAYILLTFELSTNKFQTLPPPCDYDDGYISYLIEVKGCLAIVNEDYTRIWILEDYGSKRWKIVDLMFPICWSVNSLDHHNAIFVRPVGSFLNGDILFLSFSVLSVPGSSDDQYKTSCLRYDMELKGVKIVPQLTGPELVEFWDDITKHVENIIPLN